MILRLILGIVYTAMAVGQLASWAELPGILSHYRVGGPAAMTAVAVVLVIGELASGLWFLAAPRATSRTPVWIYAAVSVLWAVLAGQAYARSLTVPVCGCFGRYLPQHLSWIVLVEDALLLVYAVLLLRAARPTSTVPAPPGRTPADTEGGRPR